jgi:hypothetical protein
MSRPKKVAANRRPSRDARCEQRRSKPKGIEYPSGISLNGNIKGETAKSLLEARTKLKRVFMILIQ